MEYLYLIFKKEASPIRYLIRIFFYPLFLFAILSSTARPLCGWNFYSRVYEIRCLRIFVVVILLPTYLPTYLSIYLSIYLYLLSTYLATYILMGEKSCIISLSSERKNIRCIYIFFASFACDEIFLSNNFPIIGNYQRINEYLNR